MIFRDDILKGQVALVTGGGTGMGREMALTFAKCGADVVLASRKLENLEPVATEIEKMGRRASYIPTDIRDPEQVERMVRHAVEKFGKLHILVNNAAGNFLVRAEELSPNGWNTVVGIVLNGTFFCSQAAGKQMIQQKYGRIINIVATYAWTGGPYTVHSAAAKAGIIAMSKTLAVEWARYNIGINCIAPGPIQTEGASSRLWAGMEEHVAKAIPAGRFGTVQEIAQAATYLVSEAGNYITGEVLTVDGGGCLNQGEFPEELIDQLREMTRKNK